MLENRNFQILAIIHFIVAQLCIWTRVIVVPIVYTRSENIRLIQKCKNTIAPAAIIKFEVI